ncbi:hypothetical protein BJ878DRAFT_481903 [Calycina marina]|uniref:CAP20-virulence factor n=1 Tax=Calycina marina TaxID=1763456 RepID=A0A9P8CER1_9HELO|nr:hypothetical protein BJ878DRAFT_481903 [Calycina marina]
MSPQINGDAPSSSSAFLSHLTSYPLISDSISTFKSNPYGAKSVSLSQQAYNKLASPLLPYLSTPYNYISPYVQRADTLGDSTLSTIESHFPLVKKPTGELFAEGKGLLSLPLVKSQEGKEYVVKTWSGEAKKTEKEGVVGWGKAAISTGIIVGADSLAWIAGFLSSKKAEAKEVTNEKLGN